MATRTVWSKGGLKLACDVSDLPAPRPKQVFALPDIAITTTNHAFITLSLQPLDFAVVAVIDANLPSGAGEWWLEWKTLPATRLAPVRITAGGCTEFLNAKPYTTYTANLMRIDAGSNVTRYPATSIETTGAYALGTAAGVAAAASAAAAAQAAANTANAALADIASDSLLTPDEKPRVIQDRDVIVAEQTGIDAQATAYAITTEKTAYDTAVTALTTYLATLTSPVLWSNLLGNTTIVGATFRTKFADVYTARQALLNKIFERAKAIADGAQGTANSASSAATAAAQAAAYSDLLARSPHNLVKNGNSTNHTATGLEGAGLSQAGVTTSAIPDAPYQATGFWRGFSWEAGFTGYFTIAQWDDVCPGDQFRATCLAGFGSYSEAGLSLRIIWDGPGSNTFIGSAQSADLSGYYQGAGTVLDVNGTAPAGTVRARLVIYVLSASHTNSVYANRFYACRKISAGMLEADLAIVGVIRSPNYVAGSYGNAPQGFKLSGYAFTTTFMDGSTSSNCFQEIGGDANFGGNKVATVNDRIFYRFNRLTNGKFAYSNAPWSGGTWSSVTKTAGTGSLATAPTGTSLSATSIVTQAFVTPPATVPTFLCLTQGLQYSGDNDTVSGVVRAYILNAATGTETLVATWSLDTYALTWVDRSVDISSIVNGGGDFALKITHTVTRPIKDYVLTGYIDEISIIA